jgi:hypothetical protein
VVAVRAVVALRPSQPAGLLYHVLVHQSVGALLR